MGKYTVCKIEKHYDDVNRKMYFEAFWQGHKIYTAYDELYSVSEVILNYMDENGWKMEQMVSEKNLAELLLVFSKK